MVVISEWDTMEQAEAGGSGLGLAQEIAGLGMGKPESVYMYEMRTQS